MEATAEPCRNNPQQRQIVHEFSRKTVDNVWDDKAAWTDDVDGIASRPTTRGRTTSSLWRALPYRTPLLYPTPKKWRFPQGATVFPTENALREYEIDTSLGVGCRDDGLWEGGKWKRTAFRTTAWVARRRRPTHLPH